MTKLAVSELTTLRWSLDEEVVAYASHGFSGIGLWRPKLEDYDLERTIELLTDHNMRVSSLSWAGGFTGSDGRGYDDAVADGIQAVQTAAAIGAPTLLVMTGGRNNHIHGHAMRSLRDALEAIGREAEQCGVSLALEPMHPGCGEEWSFVHDVRSTLEITNSIDRGNVGLVLDSYHLGLNGISSAEENLRWLAQIVPHIRLVQLGDARQSPMGEQNRCLLGEGIVPLPEILSTLIAAGYDGYFEVEILGEDVEPLAYEDVLAHTRRYLDQGFSCAGI